MDKKQDGKFGRNSWEDKRRWRILEILESGKVEVFEENGKGGGSLMQGEMG